MKTKAVLFALLAALMLLMAAPTLAQESAHTLRYDEFSFTLDEFLARHVNILHYDAADDASGLGIYEPLYTQFGLYNQFPVPESLFDGAGGIRLYDLDDLANFTSYLESVEQLRALLAEKPDLNAIAAGDHRENWLPFLPVPMHGQVVRAQAQYIETEQVRGLRYITVFQAAAEPFLSDSFFYTFQGLSADESTYITVRIALTTDLFPAEIGRDFDIVAFSEHLDTYVQESTALLNAAEPGDFSPSLDAADALVASFAFEQ